MSPEEIRKNIEKIKAAAGDGVTVLAATKTRDAATINQIYDMGIHTIGENRVNELVEKLPYLDKRFDIHFIGRLQKNKAKYIVGRVSLIHSLDSLSLAEEIEKQAAKRNIIQPCLVEINLGSEESKGGIELEETENFLNKMSAFPHIKVRGLMGVLPKCENSEKNRIFFTKISKKFIDIGAGNVDNSNMSNVAMEILSLGMTNDYPDAVACGSNLIRIGTGIFGERNYPAEEAEHN